MHVGERTDTHTGGSMGGGGDKSNGVSLTTLSAVCQHARKQTGFYSLNWEKRKDSKLQRFMFTRLFRAGNTDSPLRQETKETQTVKCQ